MTAIRNEVFLIAPPFSTSSSPYISLPTLMGWLRKNGIQSHFIDLGRDIEKALIHPDTIRKAYDFICKTFLALNEQEELPPSKAYQMAELQMLLRKLGPVYQDGERDELPNVDKTLLMEMVAAPYWPNSFTAINNLLLRSRYNIYASHDLMAGGEDDFFFTSELKNLLHQHIDGDRTLIAGISIVFDQQVIPAMQCARIIKELFPQVHVTLGGPFVTIHLRQLQNRGFFKYVDSLILDEGEEPLVALHNALLQEKPEFHRVPNLVWCAGEGDVIHNKTAPFIDLGRIPAPEYRACELNRYSDAQNMQLTVRLSKGCYWKRCAFCRVNLSLCRNYSQPDADNVYRTLCEVIDSTGVTNYLFSDESCAPEILEKISEKLCADQRTITWTFHTRIDHERLTRRRVEKFREAGCVGFTVGIETFNDRLLKLLNKGITEKEIEGVLHDLKGILPINAYMMMGLPTETEEEYLRSFQAIQQFREKGLLASVHYSLFYLASGSLMWKQPERYGINKIDSLDGEDLMPNCVSRFESDGMSRFQAFMHNLRWMSRKVPARIHEMPIVMYGEKHFSRYNPKMLVDSMGEMFIKQLDVPYVTWLEQSDVECKAIRGSDPWWMIGD